MMKKLSFIILLIILFSIAIYLRVFYINYGLPFIIHPDEPVNIKVIQNIVLQDGLNPHFFTYPSLTFYLQLPGQYLVHLLDGGLRVLSMQSMGTGITNQPLSFIIARLTTMVIGLLLIVVTMLWAAEIVRKPWVVILAGSLIVLNPILIRHSTLITPDMAATFFTTLALLGSTLIVSRGGIRSYIFAGLMAGLAGSSKYTVGSVVIAIAVAHFIRQGFSLQRAGHLLTAAAFSIAGLIVASPYLILDYQSALTGLLYQIRHYTSGHAGSEGDSFLFNARWVYRLVGIAGLGGIGLLATDNLKRFAPTMAFVGSYFILLSIQVVRFERNMMPIIPALLVITAVGCHGFFELITRRFDISHRLAAAIIIAVCALGYQVPLNTTVNRLLAYDRDPRMEARIWIERVLPKNARVAVEAYVPYVKAEQRKITNARYLLIQNMSWLRKYDYVVFSKAGSGRFLKGAYPREKAIFETLAKRACERFQFPSDEKQPRYLVFKLHCG